MTLSSGTATPTGQIIQGDGIYLEGGPEVWFQSYDAAERFTPDADGHYWGLSGTSTYPIYAIECYDDLQIMDDVTQNMVTCQNLGEVDEMQRRNHVALSFTLKSLLPFPNLMRILRGSTYVLNATDEAEGFGMGEINPSYYHVFFSRIYDIDIGDFVSLTIHKAKFSEASPISTPYAEPWNVPVQLKGFADITKPRGQRFATWKRYDPSKL
jgi:hypothetical protein